jgi:hypothetical protein
LPQLFLSSRAFMGFATGYVFLLFLRGLCYQITGHRRSIDSVGT